ncbi:MAG: hypothetical protein SFU86_18535 [Pirellulaceae bacterium]|nr:hypothetical protein [Pirellulaceae bacterium]
MKAGSGDRGGMPVDAQVEAEKKATRTICEAFIARGDVRLAAGNIVGALKSYEQAMILKDWQDHEPCPGAAFEKHADVLCKVSCFFQGKSEPGTTVDPGYYVVMDGNPIWHMPLRDYMLETAIFRANNLAGDEEERSFLYTDEKIIDTREPVFVFGYDGKTLTLIHRVEVSDEEDDT